MIIDLKTGKLPINFLITGVLLLAIGIWRIFISDWIGIIIIAVSLICIFLKLGVQIDTTNKKIKKYTGNWESINSVKNIQIIQARQSTSMNVLSISKTETKIVYKLFLIFVNKKTELISGEKNFIFDTAQKISKELQVPLIKFREDT